MYSFNFEYYYILLLFIPLAYLLLIIYRQNKFGYKASFVSDLEKIYGKSNFGATFSLVLIGFILTLYVFILAKPIDVINKTKTTKNGVDIMLALDVSYSMTATDINPNRLEAAKDVIRNFIDKLVSDRLGIIIFSGKPFTSLPLTFDYNILDEIVSKINMETINQKIYKMQGTSIGDALLLAANSFDDSDREKLIILLTDGEANRGIPPLEALKYLKKKNIKVYSVGIGGKEKAVVNVGNQRIEVGGIDEKTLNTIAKTTGGEFFVADSKKTFNDIFNLISKLEKKDIEVENITFNKEKYELYLYLLVLLFFVYILFKRVS